MASTKEIKDRIASVRETQKITSAMYLISSTKLRRARADLARTRPYFEALRAEIKRIFRTSSDIRSRYFYPPNEEEIKGGPYACLVITADKGLAGAYNQNAVKETMRLLEGHPGTKLFVVGEYGRHYFNQHHVPIEQSFLYTAQNPTLHRAREISSILLDGFNNGAWRKIYIVYTDMESALSSEAKSTRLLPFHRAHFASTDEDHSSDTFEFMPNMVTVLDNMIESYISGFIYSALIDSFCSEQNARMTAMDAANQNAQRLLDDLSLQYNRLRQSAITLEITEVSAGAKAQRQKRQADSAAQAAQAARKDV